MILVTGGAGFIGSNLVAALAERGEEVAVCDRLGGDERWRNIARHEVSDLVAPEALPAWLQKRGERVDMIVHLGAISSTTETDLDRLVEHNVRATLALWDWCAVARRPFVYASSAATYGDGSSGYEDDASPAALARLRPLNAYGWSKHFVDRRIARMLSRNEPAPPQWVGLKFFNVYGPNEYHKGAMRSVAAQNHARVRAGEPMRLFKSYRPEFADGGQRRDFIYVRDCVDAILWLLESPEVSGLFNLGTGRASTFNQLAEALFAALGRTPRIEYIDMPEAIRSRYQYHTEAPMARLRAAGYERPFTPLAEGIADYVQRYLESADPYR
jgi:ADP-L-glycero-D-manno-heptose 6-epimerase